MRISDWSSDVCSSDLQTVFCGGAIRVGTGVFHCWKRGGHGHTDMRRAVAQSCDVYFFQMARDLGYDAFAPTARMLGMGQEFDIPFPSQRYGTVPDSAWKLKKYHTKWTVADIGRASFRVRFCQYLHVFVFPIHL